MSDVHPPIVILNEQKVKILSTPKGPTNKDNSYPSPVDIRYFDISMVRSDPDPDPDSGYKMRMRMKMGMRVKIQVNVKTRTGLD